MTHNSQMLSDLLEQVPCGVCGNTQYNHIFDASDYIYGNKGVWPVAQCDQCHVVFMNPRIPPERIGEYYPRDYYASSAKIHDPYRHTWRRAAKDAAAGRFFGYRIEQHDPPIYRIIGWLMLPFTRYWTATRKYIYAIPERNGRILDIGCGNGQWLSEYKRLGWDAEGIEPSADSAAIAQQAGHKVTVGELCKLYYEGDRFDAITMWDALEHIHNPSEVMRECYRILKPGGQVYISVPNFGSWYARVFRDKWFMFTAPLHYFHYTRDTLTYLLRQHGFDSIRLSFPLGDSGLPETLRAAALASGALRRIISISPIFILLKGINLVMPRGHLLAVARKPLIA